METKRFFKVMMPGFHQKLNLPSKVSKETENQKSRKAILQSCIGRWGISLCRNYENDVICLNRGWAQFVDRHALCIGDFLVFERTNNLHFNVTVFDSSGCEKEFNDEPHKDKEEATQALNPTKRPKMSSREEAEIEVPYFEKTMIPQHATKMAKVNIPMKFMRSNNMGQQRSAVLRDPRGRDWAVTLARDSSEGVGFRMSGGWHDFYASNGLKDGDTCVFHLIPPLLTPTTIFFHVHIFPAPLPFK